MAHMMDENDKALSVRQPMWHGLEELLQEAPTRQQAEEMVHDYVVERKPLYEKSDYTGEFLMVDDFELNVRVDTGERFAVVPKTRIDPQPTEVWDVAETIMNQDPSIKIETAGTYMGGRHMYILLKLDEVIQIQGDYKGDSIAYFALQNAYVPGHALRFQPTNVRIQCYNTSSAADFSAEQAGLNLSLAHTMNLTERIMEIEEKLAAWKSGIDVWKEAKEAMAREKVTTDQVNMFIEQYIPMPNEKMISERVRNNVEVARTELLLEYFNEYNDGVRGTALGLFEAASSWTGHVRAANSQMTRFKRAMLTPDNVLGQAADLALEIAVHG